MNSRINKSLLFFGILMISVSINMSAQTKEKPTLKKAEASRSLENEDKTIKILEEKMRTASPEEKVKLQEKINAYYGKNTEKAANLAKSKEQIQDAYFQYQTSEEKLENAKIAIEKAEAELLEMEKQNNLSKDEIEARKQRLNKAKEELVKSQEALKKQMEAIKTKRAEMTKSE